MDTGQSSPALDEALGKWSSDFLVKLILEVEEEFTAACPGVARVEKAAALLKKVYLVRLGVTPAAGDLDRLFRGLLVTDEDRPALLKKLGALKTKPGGLDLLKAVYGGAEEVRGVVVLGATAAAATGLGVFLDELCPGGKACPFWDRAVIYKVLVTDQDGIAAYFPETSVLVVSSSLLTAPNLLTKVVCLHELAHAAERRARLVEGRDWKKAFVRFSGWTLSRKGAWTAKVEKTTTIRDDELTRLSKGSAFSLLPDPVIKGAKGHDGFVMAKSYEESIERNDPSEDLADAIAVFHFLPARFCFQNKPLAPRKFAWVAETVYHVSAKLDCATSRQ